MFDISVAIILRSLDEVEISIDDNHQMGEDTLAWSDARIPLIMNGQGDNRVR
jgi:hypothetical protein